MTTKKRTTRSLITYLATAGVIAAMYVVFTLPFAQFAFGPIQFRLAEILTVLPVLFPAAIPGLAIGCFLANLLNPMNLGPIDIIFGTLATLAAAVATSWIGNRVKIKNLTIRDLLALVPPVLLNAVIVGLYLPFLLTDGSNGAVTAGAVLLSMLSIAGSEVVVVYVLGFPFLQLLRRTRIWEKFEQK